MKNKKFNLWIIVVSVVGVFVLFSFPNPETNFLWYFATALFFIGLIVILFLIKSKKF